MATQSDIDNIMRIAKTTHINLTTHQQNVRRPRPPTQTQSPPPPRIKQKAQPSHRKRQSPSRLLPRHRIALREDEYKPPLPLRHTNTCKPPTDPSRCYLLELPAELRVHIYSYILAKSGRIYLKKRNHSTFAQPNILRVSSQIRREALPVYYGINSFTIRFYTRHFVELAHWLKRVVKICGAHPFKRQVEFEIQCGGFRCAFKSFTFMNLLREEKLVLGEGKGRLFSYPGRHGSDTLPGALDEMVQVAAELGRKGKSCRSLLDSMVAVFAKHVQLGESRKRDVRLAQIWKWSADLRAKVEARKPVKDEAEGS